jgi:hypothetical protein
MSIQEEQVEVATATADQTRNSGLEAAERTRKDALDAIAPHVEGEGEEGTIEQHTEAKTAATKAAFIEETTRLHATHRAAMATVNEWRDTLELARERTRQAKQKGKITEAITQVQISAANKETGMAETQEDLCSETVTRKWMPLLFNGMVGSDANPDVKQMALEAADKVCVNQIYPEGANKEQWDAFIAEYKI